jgi:hypothetical protein
VLGYGIDIANLLSGARVMGVSLSNDLNVPRGVTVDGLMSNKTRLESNSCLMSTCIRVFFHSFTSLKPSQCLALWYQTISTFDHHCHHHSSNWSEQESLPPPPPGKFWTRLATLPRLNVELQH